MTKVYNNIIIQPLGRILSNSGRSFLGLLNKKLSQLDIDRNFFALILIEQGNGTINQQDLADFLESDKVSVVRIVNYLSETGYVKRIKNNFDKRKYSLVITEKAKIHLPQIKQALTEATNIAFKGLNSIEIDSFLKTLHIIKNNLNK
jgi:DNA-binding MarR family transcriptional regulator